jgi:hypothetical protein
MTDDRDRYDPTDAERRGFDAERRDDEERERRRERGEFKMFDTRDHDAERRQERESS